MTFPPAPADPPAATPPPGNTPEDTDVYVGEDIQAAVDANPPGATITIKAGVHRLAEVLPKDGQTFAGEPGAVLSGARLLTGFAAEDGAWIVDGQEQQGQLHGECAPLPGGAYDASCRYPEDLYFDDAPLRQVTDRAELGPGHWYFDYAADRIYVADDPTGHRVEVSVARHAFFPWAPGAANAYPADVTIRDLVVEKYANPAQHGAIHAGGFDDGGPGQGMTEGWAIVGTEVRLNHGAGVRTGHGTLVADSHIHHNGQLGVRVRGRDVSLVGNEISHNNTLGFAIGWEAGGVKSMYTTGLEVRANHVHDNRGFGLWTDTDNIDTRYEGNTVAANAGAGIFHEASYAAQVIGNVVTGNGHETDGWFYGAGILIAHSPDVEVANNVLAGNADGIGAIQQDRASGAYGPHRLDNLWVHDNDVTLDGGLHGVGEDIGDPGVFDRNLRFEGNEYQLDGVTAPFAWDNLFLDAAGWHGYGHDLPAG